MKTYPHFRNGIVRHLGFGGFLLASLTSCYREAAPSTAAPVVVTPPPPAPSQVVVVEDDFTYYPQYEVYYSNRRRQYVYRDGSVWVWRPEPPHVAVNVLFSSPSVHLDFHDAPDRHHDTIIRTYPRNWSPPGRGRDGRDNDRRDRDDRRDDNRRGDRDGRR